MRWYSRLFSVCSLVTIGVLLACSEKPAEENKVPEPESVVDIHIAIDPEILEFVNQATERFQAANVRLHNNAGIAPKYVKIPGILASDQIASGKTKVDGWITQRALVELTNANIRNLGAPQTDCIPLFATPMVFAVNTETAKALNMQSSEVDTRSLLALQESSNENSQFSFSFENPQSSSLGLNALMQLTTLTAGSTELYDFVFSASGGYNAASETLLTKLHRAPSPHHRVVVTSERDVARYNSQVSAETPLLALYPASGSVWHDYQLCRSDVEWVNTSKQAALKALGNFFAGSSGSSIATAQGFRPAVATPASGTLLTTANGVTQSLPAKNITPAAAPVLQAAIKKWDTQQRPISIVFVLDTSGSFEETGIASLVSSVQRVAARLSLNDLMSIVTVSTESEVLLPPTSDRSSFIDALGQLESIGGTALYDGLVKGVHLAAQSTPPEYRSVVILVTDGPDRNSRTSSELTRLNVRQAMSGRDMSLYLVTLSDTDSNFSELLELAPEIYGQVVSTTMADLPIALENIWNEL